MPVAPLRRCTEPGCSNRVISGKCDEHRRQKYKENDKRRGSNTQRGYDGMWRKYRDGYLKRNPICTACEELGRMYIPAEHVDHIIPVIDGQRDPLFWFPANHQALCHSCHSRKTLRVDPKIKARRNNGEFNHIISAAIQWAGEYKNETE